MHASENYLFHDNFVGVFARAGARQKNMKHVGKGKAGGAYAPPPRFSAPRITRPSRFSDLATCLLLQFSFYFLTYKNMALVHKLIVRNDVTLLRLYSICSQYYWCTCKRNWKKLDSTKTWRGQKFGSEYGLLVISIEFRIHSLLVPFG